MDIFIFFVMLINNILVTPSIDYSAICCVIPYVCVTVCYTDNKYLNYFLISSS